MPIQMRERARKNVWQSMVQAVSAIQAHDSSGPAIQSLLDSSVQISDAESACLHLNCRNSYAQVHVSTPHAEAFCRMFDSKSEDPVDLAPARVAELQMAGGPHCRLVPLRTSAGVLVAVLQLNSEAQFEPMSPIQKQFFTSAACALEAVLWRERAMQSERQLELEVERYKSFISRSTEGVFRFEGPASLSINSPVEDQVQRLLSEAPLVECNDAFARMYGHERASDVIGKRLNEFLQLEDPLYCFNMEAFVRAGYSLINAESVELQKGGVERHFLTNMRGVIEDGYLISAWGTRQDITEYKKLEKRLKEIAEEATSASRAKSAFLAGVTHEIRTPLGVIMGFADLALDAEGLPGEARGFITTIKRNGIEMSRVLGEVLDLSKIEASRLELEILQFPLGPLLEEALESFRPQAREKKIALAFEPIGSLPRQIRSDPTRLRQILLNLLSNALKFTEKGSITLRARIVGDAVKGRPLTLEFFVEDTGAGVALDLQPKLFRPFVQGDSSITRKFGGTGLGLALSRQLAQALGGELRLVASQPGHGTSFAFTIAAGVYDGGPLIALGAKEPEVLASWDSNRFHDLEGRRVLVVEDSEDNQILIERFLTTAGMKVDLASNGQEGVQKATTQDYDVVVMDIQMPVLDGHQAARDLRDRGYSRPLVALTAHAFKEDRERAFSNGFNEYLTKPINRAALLRVLGSQLHKSGLH